MIRSVLCILSLTLVVGCHKDAQQVPQPPVATDADGQQIQAARSLYRQGDSQAALVLIRESLLASPENTEALRLAVDIHRSLQQPCEAAKMATQIAAANPPLASQYYISGFDLHLRCGDFKAAEDCVKQLITLEPNHIDGHRLLAQLLNAQGRRFEASEHVRQLIRLRSVQPNEILSLVDLSGPFLLVSYDQLTDDPGTSLFLLGEARRLYVGKTDPDKVLNLLQRVSKKFPDNAAAAAFRGRVLAEAGRTQELRQWFAQVPDGIQDQPEYWHAIGTWLAAKNVMMRQFELSPKHCAAIQPTASRFAP